MSPATGNCMDVHKQAIPLVEMLQAGKAKISPDKKSIVDENSHIVGKETDNMNLPKPQPPASPADTSKENAPPAPQLFLCARKCAMISKHCYTDENQNIVCINECDKESLICE
ncbi:MAG TPA: hypothetical protein VF799_11650 [Geobacteraceae bacterium]